MRTSSFHSPRSTGSFHSPRLTGSFHSPRSTGSFSRSLAEHQMPRYLSHHPTSTSALTRNHHSASALTRARKSSLPVATLDHPIIVPHFDRPTNTVSLDRPTNTVSLDRPTNTVSLDRPTNTVSLDRPTNTVSLDRPINTGIRDRSGSMDHTTNLGRAERSERVRRASTASDSPLSRNYSSLSDYKYDTRTGAFSRSLNGTGHFYEPSARKMRADLHTPNGLHHYPKSLRHIHTTGSLPRPLEGSTLEQASIHAESDAGSKSGSGCDSNASTLKAMPRSASSGRRNSEDTVVEEAAQHSRQLSLLSEQASLESSPSLQDAPQQTPPSQQEPPSPPSLSRAGSALSLEPALSSTASGYAATGSTSSLENSDSLQAKQKGTVPTPELSRAGEATHTTAAGSLFEFHGGFLDPVLHHPHPPFSTQTGALHPPFNLSGSETIDI